MPTQCIKVPAHSCQSILQTAHFLPRGNTADMVPSLIAIACFCRSGTVDRASHSYQQM